MTDKNIIWRPEEIKELAKQAGFADGMASVIGLWGLHEFARIVAAAEREMCAKLAAATICDTHIPSGIKIYGTVAAKAIRARGQA